MRSWFMCNDRVLTLTLNVSRHTVSVEALRDSTLDGHRKETKTFQEAEVQRFP